MKELERNKSEVIEMLNMINYLKEFRSLKDVHVSKITGINRRIFNYWRNGEFRRGMKNENLYVDFLSSLLYYYDNKFIEDDREKKFYNFINKKYIEVRNELDGK